MKLMTLMLVTLAAAIGIETIADMPVFRTVFAFAVLTVASSAIIRSKDGEE